MNDTQIKCFMAIADKKSFTKAANDLFISQPNVSRCMATFEKELGVTLFDRTNKTIKLTDAGKIYYDFFKRFQLEFKKAGQKARRLNNNKQGNIRLGYMEGWKISTFMPNILEKFSQQHVGIDISIECYSLMELIKELLAERLDVILTFDNSLLGVSGIKKRVVTEVQKLILYSENHTLALKEDLVPYDFRDETFFVMENDTVNLDNEIRSYCEPFGFTPKVKLVRNTESMVAAVQNGLGVAFYDVWGRNINTDGFKCLLIDSYHKVTMAWNSNSSNVAVNVLVNEVYFAMKNIS